MKQFEKWISEDEDSPVLSIDAERQREKGWRAALKEVLKQISYTPDGSIVNWIEKELETENEE